MAGPYSEDGTPQCDMTVTHHLERHDELQENVQREALYRGDAMLHLWSQIVYCYGDTDIEVVTYAAITFCLDFIII